MAARDRGELFCRRDSHDCVQHVRLCSVWPATEITLSIETSNRCLNFASSWRTVRLRNILKAAATGLSFSNICLGLDALGHDVFWLELLKTTGDKARDQKLIRIFFARFHRYGFGARCALLLVHTDYADATLDISRDLRREQVSNSRTNSSGGSLMEFLLARLDSPFCLCSDGVL